MKEKDKPTENRIFTGSDDEFSAEQAHNLINSPEFKKSQRERAKKIAAETNPIVDSHRQEREVYMAIDLIRSTKDGELLAAILKCRCAKHSYETIAKILMQNNIPVPIIGSYFSSLQKCVEFVKKCEQEGLYRVKVMLSQRRIRPALN